MSMEQRKKSESLIGIEPMVFLRALVIYNDSG